jgi:hypothetical protein
LLLWLMASLITGIISCAMFWFCIPWLPRILGILAIVFGVIAITQGSGGMAKAGLVLGIVGVVLSIVFWMAVGAGTKKGLNFLQQKSQELQQKADELQKQAEEAQKKAQEQMQRQNPTSQPGGVIIFHPSGLMLMR